MTHALNNRRNKQGMRHPRVMSLFNRRAQMNPAALYARRLQLEGLATTVCQRMLGACFDGVDRAEKDVQIALHDIAAVFDAEYCFLHLLTDDQKKIERVYEWHAEGLEPISERLIGLSGAAFPYHAAESQSGIAHRALSVASIFTSPDLAPEPEEVRAVLRRSGIQTLAYFPLHYDSRLIGFGGLRCRKRNPAWSDADLKQAKLMGEVVANALLTVLAEERLASERNLLQRMIDTVPHGLYAKDTVGRFIVCNHAVVALSGRTPDQIIGATDWDYYDADSAQRFHDDELQMIASGMPILEKEEIIHDAAGVELCFATTKTPLRSDDGTIIGIAGIGRDITARNKAIASLRETEERFHALFEAASEGIALLRVIYDANGVAVNYEFVDVNRRYETIMQTTRAAAIGRFVTETYGVKDAPYLHEFAAVASTGIPFRTEVYHEWLHKHLYMSACQMSPGYLAVLTMDITAAKQTQAELRKAETRFRNIFDHASMGVYRSTPEGNYLFVNNAMAHMYGYDSSQEMIALVGTDIASTVYVDPRRRDELNHILDNTNVVNGFEAEHRRKDGSIMLVRIHARTTRSDSGKPQYYLGFVKDITESARTARKLQVRERQFRSLAENIHDVIWTLDNEHRFTYMNPSIRALRGLEPEEAMKEGYLDSFTPESRAIIRDTMARQSGAEATGWMDSAFYLQVQQYHREGRLAWVELLMQALLDVQGHRIGYLGISRDITARKRAEEELQHASTHDKLTGLHNRAFLQEELGRMCREGRFPFSIILTDVNDLKRINDLRGHATGDELLRRAAQVLNSSSRSDALAARYGGDEFTILLPDASAVAARAAVLLLKAEILVHNSTHKGTALSMAIGVATATAPMNPDELISIVDARMYEDKRTRKA